MEWPRQTDQTYISAEEAAMIARIRLNAATPIILYTDNSGIVSSVPLRQVEEPSVVKGGFIEEHLTPLQLRDKTIQEFALSSVLRRRSADALQGCNRRMITNLLPNPGLIDIGRDGTPCYTGWCRVKGQNGETYTYGKGGRKPLPQDQWPDGSNSFYLLIRDKEDIKYWQRVVTKRPLAQKELGVMIRSFPHEREHPLVYNLAALTVSPFLSEGIDFINKYLEGLRGLEREKVDFREIGAKEEANMIDTEIGEHARASLLQIVGINRHNKETYKSLQASVTGIRNEEKTNFFWDQMGGCVVAYTGLNGELVVRALPLSADVKPVELRKFEAAFQARKLMSVCEAEHVYRAFIDPDTKLFQP